MLEFAREPLAWSACSFQYLHRLGGFRVHEGWSHLRVGSGETALTKEPFVDGHVPTMPRKECTLRHSISESAQEV